MCNKFLFTIGLLFFTFFPASAQRLINIDFGAHTNPAFSVKTGIAATGRTTNDFWNLYSRDGADGSFLNESQLLNLKLSDGTPTDADLFVTNAPGAWFTLSSDPMFESYLYPGSPNIDIHLANIPSGTYDLYVYAHGQPRSENSIIELVSPSGFGSKATSTDPDWDSNGWREGQQYVVFRSVPVRSDDRLVVVSKPGDGNIAVINGIQLMEVPGTNSQSTLITITENPQHQSVSIGAAAVFTVTASSALPLSYLWHFNGVAIPGSDTPTLRIENVSIAKVGVYRVSVSNAERTVLSAGARLQIYEQVSAPILNIDFGAHLNPFFTRKSGPAAIGQGNSDQWNLYSRDSDTGAWLDNNYLANLFWSDGSPSAIHLSVSNASGAWYTLNKDPMFESYLYPGGRSGNITALLTNLPTAIYDVYVYAHGQIPSENGVVTLATDSATFGTKTTSSNFDWDSAAWSEGKHFVLYRDVSIHQGEKLHITAKPGESGLAVINGVQLRKRENLPDASIIIREQPSDVNVPVGSAVQFSVTAESTLPLTYQWHHNGVPILGENNSLLRIADVSPAIAGSYSVTIYNGQKSVTSAHVLLQVYLPVSDPLLNIDFGAHLNPFFRNKTGPAAIGRTDTDQWNLYSRDSATGAWLENNVLGNLKWSDGSTSIVHLAVSNAGGAWYTLNKDPMFESYLYPGSRSGEINAVVNHLPAGIYDVYVYAHGQIPSENGVIGVSTDSRNYGLRVHSAAANWDLPTWSEGNHYVLFRDVVISPQELLRISSKPGQSGLSVINGVQLLQKSLSNTGQITITQQPSDLLVAEGDTAELSVIATNSLPLGYQWHINGVPLMAATNSTLRIQNLSAENAGTYRVTISNGEATVTSSAAKLQVFRRVTEPVLNIDFGAHLNPLFTSKIGPAAIGRDSTDRWNLYSRDGINGEWLNDNVLTNIVWSDGTISSVFLSVSNAAGAWYTLNSDPMFQSYLYPLSRAGNISATFDGLPAGRYDVYVYAHGQIPSENAVIELSTETTQYGFQTTSALSDWDTPAWKETNQFVVFRNVAVSDGGKVLSVIRPAASELAVINGIQFHRKELPASSEITIHRQPQDSSVEVGGTNHFAISAASELPITYQWFFNGINLTGETNSTLRIAPVEKANEGRYHVILSNGERELTSRSAVLETYLTAGRPLLNIDFGAHQNPVFRNKTGPAAIGNLTDDRWNLYSRDDGRGGWLSHNQLSNLLWSDGSPSTIQLSVSNAAGAWYTLSTDPMLESYLYPLSRIGNIEATITKLPPGIYDIYVYAHGQVPGENGVIEIKTDSLSYGIKTNSNSADWDRIGWNEGGEYVLFRSVQLQPGESLRFTSMPGSSDIAVLNGMQLVLRQGDLEPFRRFVADWTFDEGIHGNRVTAAQDSSGNGQHITQVVGNGAIHTGTVNGPGLVSVYFPPGTGGFGSGLRTIDSVDFNLGRTFTIEASLKPGSENAEHNRGILVAQNATNGRMIYGFDYRSEERRLHFVVLDASGNGEWVEARIPDDGKSHHVAGVFNNGTMSIYLDKVLADTKHTTLIPGAGPDDPVRVTLGANDIGGYWFHGTLDRVRISREILPPSEFFPHESDSTSPLVILQPLQDLTVDQGGTATFRVVAGGAPALTYEWSFEGQTLSNQTSDVLMLSNVRLADAGTYRVKVRSGPWEVSSSALLTVTGISTNAPVIQVHPQSRIAGIGTAAQFSVSAVSALPLTYQWHFNGGPIAGETNATLWVANLSENQAGTYHVIVSNSSGSAVSRGAVLNLFSSAITGGEVYLDNHTLGVDAPVTDDRGLRLSGHDFLAQLYSAPGHQDAFPVGAAIPFGTAENAGYFSDFVSRVIPGSTSGVPAVVEIRAWDARTGRTYEEAAQNGGLHGASLLTVVLGGGTLPPASLVGLQPFSLVARPRITQQPADLSVTTGRTAVFQVGVSGTPPFTYQWRFNGARINGENNPSLVISNVSSLHEGSYSVTVINTAGAVTSAATTLTVLPRDIAPPVITLTSPVAGTNTNPRITLAGYVTDHSEIVRVDWARNGQLVGPIPLTNGQFAVTDIFLSAGTNTFTVNAYDVEGNVGTTNISVTLEASRALWLGPPSPSRIYEGARLSVPVLVSSSGDIGALSFGISYDTNFFADADLEWTYLQNGAFHLVNATTPGLVQATYVLPGQSIRPGTNYLALLKLRARSIPATLESLLGFNFLGIYSAAGDAISTGTTVEGRAVELLQRRVKADNNANHRLDVGDGTALIRMLTSLDPTRSWDIPANDLNENNSLDAGDIVRVLRTVVGLDPQPSPAGLLGQQAIHAAAAGAQILLASDATLLVPGEPLRVTVKLDGITGPLSGASFQLAYPTNALRLADAASYAVGSLVPNNALTMWNLVPAQDDPSLAGTLRFAATTAADWPSSSGSIAELNFIVQPGAADQWTWTLRISEAEIGSGSEVNSLNPAELILASRENLRAQLSGGAYNATNGQFELRLTGKPGARYKVEFSEDLRTWTEVSLVSDASGNIVITDTPSAPGGHRFYRAQELD